jgi:hypothetical protein
MGNPDKANGQPVKGRGHRISRKPIYGNVTMLAPTGDGLCRCDVKKMRWYVSRGLAEVVSHDPPVFKLKFMPSGQDHFNDVFYMTPKQNMCVVCGCEDYLTRHHVVPLCFRRCFPVAKKKHKHHDIVALCVRCHERYEAVSLEMKQRLCDQYSVLLNIPKDAGGWSMTMARAKSAARALKKYSKIIPPSRRFELEQQIEEHLGHAPSEADMQALCGVRTTPKGWDFARQVMDKVDDLDAFARMWREHFMSTMKPKHMPEHWTLEGR